MSPQMEQEKFGRELLDILDETFGTHHGIYLDPGTSLFETLDEISAAEASVPVGGKCATLAAQVAHVNLFLEVLEAHILGKDIGEVDWDEIWRTVGEATPEEWREHKQRLRDTYARLWGVLKEWKDWGDERSIGGALAIVVHSAYHLGEIRQAMCALKA